MTRHHLSRKRIPERHREDLVDGVELEAFPRSESVRQPVMSDSSSRWKRFHRKRIRTPLPSGPASAPKGIETARPRAEGDVAAIPAMGPAINIASPPRPSWPFANPSGCRHPTRLYS
jgi:hypothetical protein